MSFIAFRHDSDDDDSNISCSSVDIAKMKKREILEEQYYSSVNRPFIDSVLKEIAYDNPELLSFFKRLNRVKESIIKEKIAEPTKKIDGLLNLLDKYTKQIDLLKDKMDALGLLYQSQSSYCINISKSYGEENQIIPEYDYFNGCKITRTMINNEQDTTYRKKYEDIRSENEGIDIREHIIENEINIAKRRLQHAILRSSKEKNKRYIEEKEQELEDIRVAKAREEEARKTMITYENLTPEQIEVIRKYYSAMEEVKKIGDSINEQYEVSEEIKNKSDDEETIKEAVKILEQEGVGEEEIGGIFKQLDKVASKRENKEYNFRKWSGEMDGRVEKYKGLIENFIKYIYKTDPTVIAKTNGQLNEEGSEGR